MTSCVRLLHNNDLHLIRLAGLHMYAWSISKRIRRTMLAGIQDNFSIQTNLHAIVGESGKTDFACYRRCNPSRIYRDPTGRTDFVRCIYIIRFIDSLLSSPAELTCIQGHNAPAIWPQDAPIAGLQKFPDFLTKSNSIHLAIGCHLGEHPTFGAFQIVKASAHHGKATRKLVQELHIIHHHAFFLLRCFFRPGFPWQTGNFLELGFYPWQYDIGLLNRGLRLIIFRQPGQTRRRQNTTCCVEVVRTPEVHIYRRFLGTNTPHLRKRKSQQTQHQTGSTKGRKCPTPPDALHRPFNFSICLNVQRHILIPSIQHHPLKGEQIIVAKCYNSVTKKAPLEAYRPGVLVSSLFRNLIREQPPRWGSQSQTPAIPYPYRQHACQ